MAEIFGVVTGALSVAALFNNCVECFEYIQLGRNFGDDFGRHLTTLTVAQARLTRWGKAVGIEERAEFLKQDSGNDIAQAVYRLLEQIRCDFLKAYNASRSYEKNVAPKDRPLLNENDISESAKMARFSLLEKSRSRQKGTSLPRKIKWALYDKKEFDHLRECIINGLDQLESLAATKITLKRPIDKFCEELARADVADIRDSAGLDLIEEIAGAVDTHLKVAAEYQKLDVAGLRTGHIHSLQTGRNNVGHTFAKGYRGTVRNTHITTDQVSARDQGRNHIGNTYGDSRSFWD